MSMKRNLSTTTSERHWEFVKRTADRVSQWPVWKQVQSETVIGEPRPSNSQSSSQSKSTAETKR